MSYISTPLSVDDNLNFNRDIESYKEMLDNLIELIIFTPCGSFDADPDFGFEYWNHEYSNVQCRDFNNGHIGILRDGVCCEITQKACEDSIKNSLATYEPQLKNVNVSIELDNVGSDKQINKRVHSKYMVVIRVDGSLDDGLATECHYSKEVKFLMEPTVKRYSI